MCPICHKEECICTGQQVTALFRAYLNLTGLDWERCVEWGEQFNKRIEDAAWLSTDTGISFTRTFLPEEFLNDQSTTT